MCQLFKRIQQLLISAFVVIFLFCSSNAYAQNSLSLEEVYTLSRQHYPAIRQQDLVKQNEILSVQNLNSSFLPQINLSAQGSYQSDVTKVSVPLPGIKIPSQTKDQYRAIADVSQLIYDGSVTREQKKIQSLSSAVEQSSIEVELYALKNRINNIFFNILYQDELIKQNELLEKNVNLGINKVQAQVDNGIVLRSNLQVLQAQYLQTQQRNIELKNTRKGLLNALSVLIGQPLDENAKLQIPFEPMPADTVIARPEVKLYEAQATFAGAQQKLITAKNLPKANAFVQGGYGRPGLNLISDQFAAFYITGIKVTWPLSGWYNYRRDKKLTDISKQKAEVQKENFLLNTRSALAQQKAEIYRYAALLESDKAIIDLRSNISEASRAQLQNSVINASDYLREINAEDQARQAMATHKIQLLQAQINYLLISGNL